MADPEVDLFAGMKKKKKKQVALEPEDTPEALPPVADAKPIETAAPVEDTQPAASASTEAAPAANQAETAAPVDGGDAAAATEDGDFFADMKKKKKKSKKEIPLDLETATASAEPATLDGLDVPMKKKKSKKQAQDFAKELDELDAEQEEAAAAAAGEDGELGEDGAERAGGADGTSEGQEPWVLENREATYPELLKRFFTLLHQHDPELAGEKRRYTIAPPQVAREGTKKTVFANVSDICRRMHRQPEHVIQFLYSELGTQGSVDGAQRLIMKGRYNQKQIENVLRKYINEYVTCKICKSPDTLLEKENRLYFINCESCGSRRSVAAIKAGFQAQIGKRIKPT